MDLRRVPRGVLFRHLADERSSRLQCKQQARWLRQTGRRRRRTYLLEWGKMERMASTEAAGCKIDVPRMGKRRYSPKQRRSRFYHEPEVMEVLEPAFLVQAISGARLFRTSKLKAETPGREEIHAQLF